MRFCRKISPQKVFTMRIFLNFEKENECIFFLREISLKLRNSWNVNESVLSPHAAEKNCVKARVVTWYDERNPIELYSPVYTGSSKLPSNTQNC